MESHPHLLGIVPPVPKYSKELQTAVQDDVRRQEVDSAKKRAAAQNVDYESFAALVSMAHVKPFERRKGQREESVKHIHALPAWSFDASGALAPSDSLQTSFSELSGEETNKRTSNVLPLISNTENLIMKAKGNKLLLEEAGLPAATKCSVGCFEVRSITADVFKREWRRVGTNLQDKLKFLLALPPGDLSKIFKAELPPSILADVIDVLCWWKQSSAHEKGRDFFSSFPESHVEGTSTCDTGYMNACKSAPDDKTFDVLIAFQILSSLSVCGRFSLSLKLAGTRVQSSAMRLIEQSVQCLEMNEMCNEQADDISSMCSSDRHVDDAKVECLPKGLRANGTDEQTISKDDLKQLANLYSCM